MAAGVLLEDDDVEDDDSDFVDDDEEVDSPDLAELELLPPLLLPERLSVR